MDMEVLNRLSYGLYIITSTSRDRCNGMIADAVFQVTANPVTIGICINKKNLTHDHIESSRVFAVSILSETAPAGLISHFGFKSGREIDKCEGITYRTGITGSHLIMDHTVGIIECRVNRELDVGTHTIFIGEVVDAFANESGTAMTYTFYRESIKSKLTSSSGSPRTMESSSRKYRCTVCDYIYDPQLGDLDSGIAPGTRFEDIPDSWVCPWCKLDKSVFEPID